MEREAAEVLISSLKSYCDRYWNLYLETIVRKRRAHGFPLRCLSCGCMTRWQRSSGLRVGPDGRDHQYCKAFTSSLLPSTKSMLCVPTIKKAWSKIRKSFDANDVGPFQQRVEAQRLAADLGYTAASSAPQSNVSPDPNPTDNISNQQGWHCFDCPKSSILQPLSRQSCIHCGEPRLVT